MPRRGFGRQTAFGERWARWLKCSLCEQQYHGIVLRALSWACWKTYVGRPEVDLSRRLAMSLVGDGLSQAKQCEEENAAAAADPSKKLPADLELEKIRAAYRRGAGRGGQASSRKVPRLSRAQDGHRRVRKILLQGSFSRPD